MCPYGYDSVYGDCGQAYIGISCNLCNSLVSAANNAVSISKPYSTYQDAQAALKTSTCFYIPFPLDIGCAAVIVGAEDGFAIINQITEPILSVDNFCQYWGCTS